MASRMRDSGAAPTRDDYPLIVRGARILLTLVLIPLSWHAFHDRFGEVPLLSGIDLAIHEFGHILFMPFGIAFLGRTMVILGGSPAQGVDRRITRLGSSDCPISY